MKYLFKGGVLDGQEFGEESGLGAERWLIKVPIKDGKWHSYASGVIPEYQSYILNGNVYEFNPELSYR